MKWVGVTLLILLAFAAVFARLWLPYRERAKRIDEATRHLQGQLDIIRQMDNADYIVLKGLGWNLELRPPKDSADINAIMRSLRRLQVVRGNLNDETKTDQVLVSRGNRYAVFWGCFDPARAPVVSSYLRSDDLGKVVYDVCRHKGITPRRKSR